MEELSHTYRICLYRLQCVEKHPKIRDRVEKPVSVTMTKLKFTPVRKNK